MPIRKLSKAEEAAKAFPFDEAFELVCGLNEEQANALQTTEDEPQDAFYYHVERHGDLAYVRVTDSEDFTVGYL